MSLLPIISTRTSDSLRHQRLVHQINSDQTQLQKLFDQVSSGRRLLSGSDDPAAASRALSLQNELANFDQVARNAGTASSFLSAADNALSTLGDSLSGAKALVLEASQNLLGESERTAILEEFSNIISQVVMTGNQDFAGASILGGVLNNELPLNYEGNQITFQGNESAPSPHLARATTIRTMPTAADALGVAKPVIQGNSMFAELNEGTFLRDARQGEGIEPGVLKLGNGSGWVEVDLRGAVTMGDLKSRIEDIELGGRGLSFSVSGDSVTLEYADGLNGTLLVDDALGSHTARQLNLLNPYGLTPPPLIGGDLEPRTTPMTRLEDVNLGAGIDVSDGLVIQQGDETFDIDLSDAETLDDVITAINRSGADVRAEYDGASRSIRVRLLTSGVDYSIGESGGNAAELLGIRTATSETRLDSLVKGRGVVLNAAGTADLSIRRPDGNTIDFSAEGLETVGDVIDAINNHPDNQDSRRVVASLKSFGNGIQLTGSVDTFQIEVSQPGRSTLGTALGLIPEGQETASGISEGGQEVFRGDDYLPVEPEGTLDTLLRMRQAIIDNDLGEMERLAGRMDSDMDRATRTRGVLGFHAKSVDTLRTYAEDQALETRSRLSDNVDADLTAMISQITTRQTSLQASLQLIGKAANLTVLNYL